MKLKLSVRHGFVLVLAALLSSRSDAQLVETGIILRKTKDLGAIIDKGTKDPKVPSGAQPQTEPAPRSKPAGATSQPRTLSDTFSSETEDLSSVLEITPDVLTRFSAALAAETAKRDDAKNPLTRAKYDSIGAGAGGFTPRQYFVLKARLRPFCEAVAASQAPPDDLTLSYLATEAMVIKPRCSALLPGLQHNWAAMQIERGHAGGARR
jgi:hypothetical protein